VDPNDYADPNDHANEEPLNGHAPPGLTRAKDNQPVDETADRPNPLRPAVSPGINT
jgi:hypothetical protein